MKIAYTEKESRIFGNMLKPVIYMEIFSQTHSLWCGIDDVLVDTGADITLIPRNIGKGLVADIHSGEKASIKGITPFELSVYIHSLKIRVANNEFETKVAIANADEVPVVLGRYRALDIFHAIFDKGKEFSLR
jgi:predicted aspartyl protease